MEIHMPFLGSRRKGMHGPFGWWGRVLLHVAIIEDLLRYDAFLHSVTGGNRRMSIMDPARHK